MTQDAEDVVARVANAIWAETNYAHEGSVIAEFGELLDQHEHDKERAFRQARAALEASERQSLSDRIDVLEGALRLVRQIAEPLIQVDDVWEDATHIVTAIDNALDRAALHQEGIAP